MGKIVLFILLLIPSLVSAKDKIDYNYINCVNFEVDKYTIQTAPALCYSALFPGEISCLSHKGTVACMGNGVNFIVTPINDHTWEVFNQQRDELVAVIYYNFSKNSSTLEFSIEYSWSNSYSTCTYLGEIITLCGI